jgi:hypothetical protein
VHFHNRTEHAVSFPLGLARPLVRATTPAHRKRPRPKLKMGGGRGDRPRAPSLCGGGGAPTSWRVGFLADPLSDRVRRLLGPPSLYGAHTGPFSDHRCATGMDDARRGTAGCRWTRPVCWLRHRRVSDATNWAQIGRKAVASYRAIALAVDCQG